MKLLSFAWKVVLGATLTTIAGGCTTVAQVTTLAEPACRQSLESGLARVFESQGETAQVARQLAVATTASLGSSAIGPRPFVVPAPSGVDYGLFVQQDGSACLLRLYGRQK